MKILQVRNVHEALPRALRLLDQEGVERPSRNGPVLLGPSVTTIYERPCERVLFWPERDANPFFHLYESLWMLAGRNDVAGPARYAKSILNYSDDGKVLHGAYGYRWRGDDGEDQLQVIAERLRHDPNDRRCVLQMWNSTIDLGYGGKDVPCNLIATFQRGITGELNLTVFCRSNDIVWGAYGANAVHFSFLLEYMALWIGCSVGTYMQISVNWHGYLNTLEQVKNIRPDRLNFVANPYTDGRVKVVPITGAIEHVNQGIHELLVLADTDEFNGFATGLSYTTPWISMVWHMLHAHQLWRTLPAPERYTAALKVLGDNWNVDWLVAGREWLQRRQTAYECAE